MLLTPVQAGELLLHGPVFSAPLALTRVLILCYESGS